jgi:hypothetical protein
MIPDDWCKGIIKQLHKSGSIYDLNNYRGITLTSNVNKVFSKILETLILDFLVPFSHNNAKRPSRQTLSKAFDRSKKAK